MCCIFLMKLVRRSLLALLTVFLLQVLLVSSPSLASTSRVPLADCPPGTFPGTEAFASTIILQMPFIAGETWTVGGAGSFYGNGKHCNEFNDYYATDWNRTNDDGANVLPVADGVVSDILAPPCPAGTGYGCYVQIDHANGYRTLYAHLSQVLVANQASVHTWTLIGEVGQTGVPPGGGPHLHLTFKHNDNGYFSYCWNNGQTCLNTENPQWPQGHRPSPMMTASGATILEDFQSYTSVNGRIYLPDLRNNDNGWTSEFYVRNDGTESRNVKIAYYTAFGTNTTVETCPNVDPNERCWIPMNVSQRLPPGTTGSAYIDGGEAVSVVVIQWRASPEARAAYLGVSQPSTRVHVPLLHRNNYGLYSEIYVQNNWPTSTNVTLQYKVSPGQPGGNCIQTIYNVPARGLQVIRLSEVDCIGTTFVGSAYVTNSANNALAVASTQRKSDHSNMAESSGAGGTANTAYAPLIQNNNYGWISGIALQNASSSTNNLTANVYNQTGGSPCRTDTYFNIGARRSQIISTPGGACTSVASAVYGGGSQPVAAIVNQVLPGTPSSTDYEAIAAPSKKVVVPLWSNQPGWISGLVVQNVNTQSANITITFYDAAGNPSGSPLTAVIQPRTLYIASSTGVADGSAVVTADRPVAVAVNHFLSISGDGSMSHIGVQR